jgi:MoxR-like ATPase
MDSSTFQIYKKIRDNISGVFRGDTFSIDLLLFGFLSNGHILLEDLPGTGKTTLSKALAMSVKTDFKRVQFTPDLLPSDITGVNIYDSKEKAFRIQKGPVFTNILLADEINRTTSRTQSALLEAMEEKQVTIDGEIYALPDDFFVVATLNPAELQGTYPLPESQIDRFALRYSLGYLSKNDELSLLEMKNPSNPLEFLKPCADRSDLDIIKKASSEVHAEEDIKDYIVEIVRRTRTYKGVLTGASPRASIALLKLAKVMAISENSDFIIPEYILRLAPYVLNHRIILDQYIENSRSVQEEIIAAILKETPLPR